jgi:hemolysin activation/secretion protein
VIGFYDHVKIKNLDTGSTERSRLIRSVGGGLRLLQTQRFALDLLYAHPLDRVISTDKTKPKDRFLASLTVQLQPWGGR